jgi:post-segregation antitoxin (ccd killing protein)
MQDKKPRKRQVKVTLDRKMWEEARAFGINVSAAGEAGLRAAIERARAEDCIVAAQTR